MEEQRLPPDPTMQAIDDGEPVFHGRPAVIAPWPDMADNCCFVTARYEWQKNGEASRQTDVTLPPFIAHSAPRRRAEFIAGQACAREALRHVTGEAITPGRDSDRAPIWPQGTVGSVSHCNGRAIAVAARCQHYSSLGIDIERILTAPEAKDIASQVLTENERRKLPYGRETFAISLAFSAKESLFKALYPLVRQFHSFHAAEFRLDETTAQARLHLTTDWSAQWQRGRAFEIRFRRFNTYILTCISIPSDLSG